MMIFAAVRVSPGGLGDGACTKAWRKEMCAARSASITRRRSVAFIAVKFGGR